MELRRGRGRVLLFWRGQWAYSFLSPTVTGADVRQVVTALATRQRERDNERRALATCAYCGALDAVQGGACRYCGGV